MSSFQLMSEKLAKTGLYNTNEGQLVYAELMAYAEGLDIYYTTLDELIRECFVSTAETYGLEMREKFINKYNIDSSIEGRRKSIITALSVCNSDFTESGFQKCLEIFGLKGTLTEDVQNQKITFISETSVPKNRLELIKNQLSAFVPPHFEFEFIV